MILPHKPFRMAVQPKYKHFNKTLLFFACNNKSRHKDKDCITDIKFIRSISVLHAGLLFLRSFLPPGQVTSDFDVCEIDQDM